MYIENQHELCFQEEQKSASACVITSSFQGDYSEDIKYGSVAIDLTFGCIIASAHDL